MILICEQCQARYLLASLLLGVDGRKVKCGVCGNTWFQPPVDEKYEAPKSFGEHLEHEILEPIPEGVRPIPEGSTVPALKKEKITFQKFKDSISRESMTGAVSAVAVFALILGGLFLFHTALTRAWPPLGGLFALGGVEMVVPGDGLVFDKVSAKAKPNEEGKYVLTVTGNIINVHKNDAELPPVFASLQKEGGVDSGANFTVPMEAHSIGPEATVPFTATYEGLTDEMTEVTVKFAVK